MNYAVILSVNVKSDEQGTLFSVHARGNLILEPRIGNELIFCDLKCDPDCYGVKLKFDYILEDLSDKYVFVRAEIIDPACLNVDRLDYVVDGETLANEISDYFTANGWQVCDGSGNSIVE